MAHDLFVYWKDKKPTSQEIAQVLKDYLGEAGSVTFETDRWHCVLPGKTTNPLQSLDDFKSIQRPVGEERCFEVYIDDDSIDIITRNQDEFTRAVVNGFRELCVRVWQGEIRD